MANDRKRKEAARNRMREQRAASRDSQSETPLSNFDNFLSYIFRIIQSITDKFNTNLRCIWKICSFSSRQRTKKPDIIFDLSKILEKAAKYKSYCKNVKCILPSKVRKFLLNISWSFFKQTKLKFNISGG